MKIFSFEGIEGVGKSTQINLLKEYLQTNGYNTEILREPGSTITGESIRSILLDSKENLSSESELLLMFAARAQLISEKVNNSNSDIILFDRFYDASLAYQGFGRNLPIDFIQSLITFINCPEPCLTFLLDISVQDGFERKVNDVKDRIESAGNEFFKKVREGYLEIANNNQSRIKVIDAMQSIDDINKSIIDHVNPLL
ncbi:dTMP kinase [Gammaproteobacteria bacterium]|nr:dTMP kinase [Gammaproteobacteria bacterium]MDA8926196.1 dTMP kinase [Gammaproteobacteria bacterium]MDA8997746.1 dTMP kinase [Gammaproteobacteria bacterium]MDA8999295.1 dTMP kinase [Gammaproteobacteria bacterium]MDA9220596.1 dTMP kinase [Gammaproteobacteria bacterium]